MFMTISQLNEVGKKWRRDEEIRKSNEEYQIRQKKLRDEYQPQIDALLEKLPPEFRAWADYYAYEQGHSSGLSEIYCVLCGLVDSSFLKALKKYTDRIKNT